MGRRAPPGKLYLPKSAFIGLIEPVGLDHRLQCGGGAGQLTTPPVSTEPPVPETAVAEEEDTGPSPFIILGAALVAIGIVAFFIIWMRKRIERDRPGSSRKHRPTTPTLATPRAVGSQRPRGRSRSAGAPPPPPRKRAGKAHKKKRSR